LVYDNVYFRSLEQKNRKNGLLSCPTLNNVILTVSKLQISTSKTNNHVWSIDVYYN